MSGRTPPERTPAQQKAHEREQALRDGTPAAVRAWAQRYDVPLIGIDDDEMLLISIHEARVELFQGAARRKSIHWLAANKARIIAERESKE
jgi:hypothetical protein